MQFGVLPSLVLKYVCGCSVEVLLRTDCISHSKTNVPPHRLEKGKTFFYWWSHSTTKSSHSLSTQCFSYSNRFNHPLGFLKEIIFRRRQPLRQWLLRFSRKIINRNCWLLDGSLRNCRGRARNFILQFFKKWGRSFWWRTHRETG